MAQFKDITIQNFRGISELKINDLGLVNIFLGKNNYGKTSLLESVFLLSGMSNAMLASRVNCFRDPSQTPNPLGQIKYIFHNVQLDNKPTFYGRMDNDDYRKMSITLNNTKKLQGPLIRNGMISTSEHSVNALCMSQSFETGRLKPNGKLESKKTYTCDFCTYENGQYSQDSANDFHENMSARYISSTSDTFNLMDELSLLVRANKKDEVIKLVKLFDPRIQNIEVLPDTVYIAFEGIQDLLPISLCGDGLKKFLYIISCVAGGKNKVLLIDEIDNGIHFSAYKLLWKSIIRMARENNVQLMITTHSKEVLAELASTLDDNNSGDVCAYTITKTADDVMRSYRYDGVNVKTAIENHLEMRN